MSKISLNGCFRTTDWASLQPKQRKKEVVKNSRKCGTEGSKAGGVMSGLVLSTLPTKKCKKCSWKVSGGIFQHVFLLFHRPARHSESHASICAATSPGSSNSGSVLYMCWSSHFIFKNIFPPVEHAAPCNKATLIGQTPLT